MHAGSCKGKGQNVVVSKATNLCVALVWYFKHAHDHNKYLYNEIHVKIAVRMP